MKQVPFYGNHEDGMHCMLATYRSVLDYFLQKRFDWDAIEGLTGYKTGLAAWTVSSLPKMQAMGLDIRMIEPFDYQRYLNEGEEYLRTIYSPEEIYWYRKNTNILNIKDDIPEFLKHIKYECRRASLKDIDAMLSGDRLVFVTVNSKILNGSTGFVSHAILVLGKEGNDYVVHNPGPPPVAYQKISSELLWDAMGGDNNTAEVTGFKLKGGVERADILVAERNPLYSRASLAKLFSKGMVRMAGKPLKAGSKVAVDSNLDIDISILEKPIEGIELPILYEDDDCLVINKPAGILSHAPGTISNEATVATFLREKLSDLKGQRGGIVHRLDRATSGVMICAKSSKGLAFLQKQFADRKVSKTYIAVVSGHIDPQEAIIDMPIERNPKAPATFRVGPNGKSARTHYKVIKSGIKNDLLELKPETGRTHQLRVHLAKRGHPIIGDPLYGKGKHGDRLYLHAKSLEIILPNKELKKFEVPVPNEFEAQL
jgi:23S rRNA pseudouridine1911/1915/1917 synthase